MFHLPSVRIGRIFGIPVEVSASWLLIFVLVWTALSFSYFPELFPDRPFAVDLLSGLVTSLLFFGSVLLHEVSHSLVARAGGSRIAKIELFIFGGIAHVEQEPESPGREFIMAVAGPGMSLALAALSWTLFSVMRVVGVSDVFWAPFQYLAVINVSVVVFNLLPGFPLDGGRVLRALLWKSSGSLLRATRWASLVGQAIGYGLMAIAVLGVLFGMLNLIWLAVLGWFLTTLAHNAYRDQVVRTRLHDFTVGSRMSSPAVVAPGDLTLVEMVDRYFLGGRHSKYPVVVDGAYAGLLSMDAVRAVPRERWSSTRVSEIVPPDDGDLSVRPESTLDSVLGRLGPGGPGALLVVEDGRLVGILTRSDVVHALRELDHPRNA